MSKLSVAEAQAIFSENFADWVQDLGLKVEAVEDQAATLRLPFNDRLNRQGGTVCGQAMLALADTSMVFAVSAARGSYGPMTTVSQTLSFMRPVANADVLAEAKILRLGRNLAFGEVVLRADGDDRPVAHATSTYALLPPPKE
ncbi:MAG: PaaI family thioesterase [Alphaproteobacteria bacterium]|nr:PaaI family thioesterase [Alphaproteobacteria bacterium]